MRELWQRILQTGGVKIYGVFLGFVSISITTRFLGPEGRGHLVLITTWVTTFSTFAFLSLGQVTIHKASNSKGLSWLPSSYSCLTSFTVFATLSCWLIFAIAYASPLGRAFESVEVIWLILGFLTLPFLIWEQYGSSMLMALERLDVYNRFQFFGRSFSTVMVIVLVWFLEFGPEGVLTANLLGQIIVAMGGIVFLNKLAGGWKSPRLSCMKGFVCSGMKLHMNAIGMFFISGSDILVVNYYSGPEETAFYQLSVKLIGVFLLLPQAANMVVYGKVSAIGPDQAWPAQRKILLQLLVLMVIGATIAGFSADWWLVLLAGKDFTPTVDIFCWSLLALFGMTFSVVMAPQWIARGFFWTTSLLALLFGGLNLVLNFLFVPEYGMYGALTATLITYGISILVNASMAVYCQIQYQKTKYE